MAICPPAGLAADSGSTLDFDATDEHPIDGSLSVWLLALSLLLALGVPLAAALAWRQHRLRRHQRAVRGLLDRADDLERTLYRLRDRMRRVRGVVGRMPDDIGANADASLQRGDLIENALKDLLEHRLWIQRCADAASADELERARQALDASLGRIRHELERLEHAGRALELATDLAAAGIEPTRRRRH
ncbi:MAG TPA: hypothetical protein DDZ76_15155 [Xanthomonadales bacterium]|nr:hypothetical protein [Xanthomonadales bacterium]